MCPFLTKEMKAQNKRGLLVLHNRIEGSVRLPDSQAQVHVVNRVVVLSFLCMAEVASYTL